MSLGQLPALARRAVKRLPDVDQDIIVQQLKRVSLPEEYNRVVAVIQGFSDELSAMKFSNYAEAVATMAKINKDRTLQRAAMEIQRRAERRAAQIVLEKYGTGGHGRPGARDALVKDAGIERTKASQIVGLARLKDEEFNALLVKTSGLVRLSKAATGRATSGAHTVSAAYKALMGCTGSYVGMALCISRFRSVDLPATAAAVTVDEARVLRTKIAELRAQLAVIEENLPEAE